MHFEPHALGIAVLLVTGVGALVAGCVTVLRRPTAALDRLSDPIADLFGPTRSLEIQANATHRLAQLLRPLARIASPVREEELARLRLRLQQGGLRGEHAVPLFLAAKVALAVASVVGFVLVNASRARPFEPAFLIAVVSFATGFYGPDVWLASRTRTRQTAIERGLPDTLDLLVTCVEAGLGMDAALQRVADEVRLAWPVLASELQTSFLEVKAGIPRPEAFRRLAARTGVSDLKSLAATLTQTETFGTSVALALRVQAETIRVRRMHRAEERAAYVSVKMTLPLILCILPALMIVVIGPAMLNVAKSLLPALRGSP